MGDLKQFSVNTSNEQYVNSDKKVKQINIRNLSKQIYTINSSDLLKNTKVALTQPLPDWHQGFGQEIVEKIDQYMFSTFLPQHTGLDVLSDADKCDELEIQTLDDNTVEMTYFFLMPDGETEIAILVKMTNIEREGPRWMASTGIVHKPTEFIVVSEDNEPIYPIRYLDQFIVQYT